ncbi:MAG TPA: hypothetical protein G4O19_03870 [Dehalococcoidia bacterium]|nr:hypothetical protein [Dehalococcoidia bacterium]
MRVLISIFLAIIMLSLFACAGETTITNTFTITQIENQTQEITTTVTTTQPTQTVTDTITSTITITNTITTAETITTITTTTVTTTTTNTLVPTVEGVQLISETDCEDGSLCYHVEVERLGLAPREAEIRASFNPDSKGTVIFLVGGWGKGWYGDAGELQLGIINIMRDEGYETYEIRWLGDFGWGTDNFGQGFKRLSCGTAKIITWIVTNIASNPNVVGATGQSGGANELAYGLSIHNLESIIDVIVLTGGPGRVDLVAICQMDVPNVRGIVDYVMGWQGDGDYCTGGNCPEWVVQALQSESIITPLSYEYRDYDYPNTQVIFIEGEEDIFTPQGRIFFDAITCMKQWIELEGLGHGIPGTPLGASSIKDSLLEGLGNIVN